MPDGLSTYAKGVMGETAAAVYLTDAGMTELFRRYRSPYGEIDLIMQEKDTLVFVEVKVRERMDRTQALYAITPAKQRRMMDTVRWFLGEHPEYAERMMRFDAVTVTRDGILHLPNAFEGQAW